MKSELTDLTSRYQVMWVIGALERLATLKLLGPTPHQVSQKWIDTFLQLDEYRDNLFVSDNQLKELLRTILETENGVDDAELLESMFCLVKDYKNNREQIVKYALSQTNC